MHTTPVVSEYSAEPVPSPLRLLLVTLAGWVNRHQQEVIEYLVEENRVLREQLKGRRVRLTDDQRRFSRMMADAQDVD